MDLQVIGSGGSFLDSVQFALCLLNRNAGFEACNHQKVKLALLRDQLVRAGYKRLEDLVALSRPMSCLARHDGQDRKAKRLRHDADDGVYIGSDSNRAANH